MLWGLRKGIGFSQKSSPKGSSLIGGRALVFCLIGIYTVNNSTTDLLLTAFFAAFGYLLVKVGLEPAPLVLGFILGPLMEENLRRSLVLSRGDPMIFVTRPLSLTLLLMAAAVVLLVALPQFRKTRATAFQE